LPQTDFAPENPGWNDTSRLTVTVLPEPVLEDVAALNMHWLFDSVTAAPSVTGPCHALLALLASEIWLVDRAKENQQLLTKASPGPIRNWAL